jgi:hypothetical protein
LAKCKGTVVPVPKDYATEEGGLLNVMTERIPFPAGNLTLFVQLTDSHIAIEPSHRVTIFQLWEEAKNKVLKQE